MSLCLLLDEQISYRVAEQIRTHRPDLTVQSVRDWRGGVLRGCSDDEILRAARSAALTLVTFDLRTIPRLVA